MGLASRPKVDPSKWTDHSHLYLWNMNLREMHVDLVLPMNGRYDCAVNDRQFQLHGEC